MTELRVLSIFGTRPEAVKMSPVIHALSKTTGVKSLVCLTAQHREMLDQVIGLFNIQVDIDLNLMRPGQSLSEITAAIFTHLDPVLADYQPDWVLVQGDTTTVMAASMLAFYHRILIGHVEAGLRTGDKYQPYPEEINRRVTSVVTDLHFAPTKWAHDNLIKENIPANKIVITGNPVIDALQHVASLPPTSAVSQLFNQFGLSPMKSSNQSPKIILITAHRRENFGEPLVNICKAISQLAEHYGDQAKFIYPVHLNPNVQEPVYRLLGNIPNIHLLPPLDYLPWIHLIKHATLILTDSGGLQEEAPGLGVPVLVLRRVTERPEGIQAGTVRLVGTETDNITTQTRILLDNPQEYQKMSHASNPYGDGQAAKRIVQAILEYKD